MVAMRWQKVRDFVWNVLNLTPELTASLLEQEETPQKKPKVNEGFSFPEFDSPEEADEVNLEEGSKADVAVSVMSEDTVSDPLYGRRKLCCNVYIGYQIILILTSVLMFILASVDAMKTRVSLPFLGHGNASTDSSKIPFHYVTEALNGYYMRPQEWITIIALITNTLMCIDLISRVCFAPAFKAFLNVYNAIDFVSICPIFVEAFFVDGLEAIINSEDYTQFLATMRFLDFLSFLRLFVVFRIFRLLRRYQPTRVLFYSVRKAFGDMAVLLLLVVFLIISFGAALYLSDKSFNNIPQGMWFALVTLSTVGYGDITPLGALGCIFTGVLIICGILLTSYVVPIVVSNFELYYNHTSQLEYLSRLYQSANQRQLERYLKYLSYRMLKRTRGIIKNVSTASNNNTITAASDSRRATRSARNSANKENHKSCITWQNCPRNPSINQILKENTDTI
ncbi:Potassium voltage-gated channel subfamily C member 4 [Cichlidogyrus casuarinus]|uniref:Potassium voltage-gated channel subfamily C member 4 n=1 Tax=Cichlidogyrus casuarinus TaxID=1844966 RepID=A0ABD2Q044_9PLAT